MKDAPIDAVGEGLALGKAIAGTRRGKCGGLLAPGRRQGKNAREPDCDRAGLQGSARLLQGIGPFWFVGLCLMKPVQDQFQRRAQSEQTQVQQCGPYCSIVLAMLEVEDE